MLKIKKDLYETISHITWVEYEGKEIKENYYVEDDNVIAMLEDLISTIYNKEEEIEDIKQDIQDNYNMKSPYELYAINEEDFH